MSLAHLARSGLITKAALPTVSRQRGPMAQACQMLINANGADGVGDVEKVTDSSSNALTMLHTGDVYQTSMTPFGSDGKWCAFFDGSNDYIYSASNTAATQFGTGDFTVEGWVYLEGTTSGGYAFFDQGGNNSAGSFGVFTSGGNWIVRINGTGQDLTYAVSSGHLNTWLHLAVVRSSGTLTFYINGASVASGTRTQNVTNYAVCIGQLYGLGSYWKGMISNVRVVKGTAVYTANFTPSTSPLTAISGTTLLTCNSGVLCDQSTGYVPLVQYGGVRAEAISPFGPGTVSGGSALFGSYVSSTSAVWSYTPTTITTGEFTIEAWICPTSVSSNSYNTIFENWGWSYGNGIGFMFYLNSSGQVLLRSNNGTWNTAPVLITSSRAVPLNVWTHVALVRDSGNTLRIYINGIADANTVSSSLSLNLTSGGPTPRSVVGASYNDGSWYSSQFFYGNITNVRVVVGTCVYTSNFVVPTSPLTAITNTQLLLKFDSPLYKDSSPLGYPLLRTLNTATQQSASPFSGYMGSVSVSSGNNFYSSAPYATDWLGSGNFTIEAWVYPTSSNYQTIASTTDLSSNRGFGWDWRLEGGNNIKFYIGDGVSYDNEFASGGGSYVTNNTWNHIALVRNGSTFTIYVNGVSRATATWPTSTYILTPRIPLRIGARGSSTDEPFAGSIANFRIVNGTAVYTSGFTPSTAPLTAITGTTALYLFDNIGMSDSAGISAFTFNGTAHLSTTQFKQGSASLYLNGTSDYITAPNSASLQLTNAMFSIEAWVYRAASGVTHSIVCKGSGSSGWLLQINSSNKLIFLSNSTTILTSTSNISSGAWVHVAVTRDINNIVRLFVNGTSEASYTDATSFSQSDVLTLGADRSQTNFFSGYLDDVRIFNNGAPYIASFTAPTTELVATDNVYKVVSNAIYGVNQLA